MKIDRYAIMVVTQNGITKIVPTKKDWGEWVRFSDYEKATKKFVNIKTDDSKPTMIIPDNAPAKKRGRPKREGK